MAPYVLYPVPHLQTRRTARRPGFARYTLYRRVGHATTGIYTVSVRLHGK